jgi:hypothetical protein
MTEEHGASAGAIGTPSDDGVGKMATSGDPPEVRLDGGKGDERAELFAVSNASDGRSICLFLPRSSWVIITIRIRIPEMGLGRRRVEHQQQHLLETTGISNLINHL